MVLAQVSYWTIRDSSPNSPTYGQTRRLFRWIRSPGFLSLDKWDANAKEWVDCPSLLGATGIGGYTDYEPMTQDEAIQRFHELGGTGDPLTLDPVRRAALDRAAAEAQAGADQGGAGIESRAQEPLEPPEK